MRILAPYTTFNVKVVNALYCHAPRAEFVYTGYTDQDYWHAIAERWQGEDDLVIIEQDNEVHEGVIESFRACDQPWCAYWYLGPPIVSPDVKYCMSEAIGCVKFSKEIQYFIPHQEICDYDTQSWDTIDNRLVAKIKSYGFRPHVHGQVRHHHVYQVFFLPSPSNKWRPFVWRHVGKGEYPAYLPGGERYVPKLANIAIPEDAETMFVDASRLEGEEWRIYPEEHS